MVSFHYNHGWYWALSNWIYLPSHFEGHLRSSEVIWKSTKIIFWQNSKNKVRFFLPISLWVQFLRAGTRYSKTDFWISLSLGSHISKNYRFFSKMANQLMISWSNRSSPRTIKVYLEGCYGYQNDHKARFSSFPVTMSHLDDVVTK